MGGKRRAAGPWDQYSLPQLAALMAVERPEAAREQGKALESARDNLRAYRGRLAASAQTVLQQWPADGSGAAGAFRDRVSGLLDVLDDAINKMTNGLWALNDATNAVEQTKRKVDDLYRQWDQFAEERSQDRSRGAFHYDHSDPQGKAKRDANLVARDSDAQYQLRQLEAQARAAMNDGAKWITEVSPNFQEVPAPPRGVTDVLPGSDGPHGPGGRAPTGGVRPPEIPTVAESRAEALARAEDWARDNGQLDVSGSGSQGPSLAGAAPVDVGQWPGGAGPGGGGGPSGGGGWSPGGPGGAPGGGGAGYPPSMVPGGGGWPGGPSGGGGSSGRGAGGGVPGFGGAGGGRGAGSGGRSGRSGGTVGGRRGSGAAPGMLGGAGRAGRRDREAARGGFNPDDPWRMQHGVPPVLGAVPEAPEDDRARRRDEDEDDLW